MKTARPKLAPAVVRVALYARISVDDSDAEFGSVDAQREAVEAYVASQASNGWRLIEERFEDRGCSGSNVQRPAFKLLMHAVRAGAVDVVAVHKLDRLSRSIADFVALMAEFEKHDVTFVSITQQFSTATSVGRLALNMLMTFAQFEREQISERTKLKVNAARRRGLWTGGPIPMGFDLIDGRLAVNIAEAERVRAIYELFLARGSWTETLTALRDRGWQTKTWTTQDGTVIAPRPFEKDTLRRFLLDPVPRGRVRLGDETFEGQHEAILDPALASAVESALTHPVAPRATQNKHAVLLRGLVKCAACGTTMRVGRGGKGRPYFVCGRAVTQGAQACAGSRIAVPTLEEAVLDRIRAIGTRPELVDATIAAVGNVRAEQVAEAGARVRTLDADRARLERERERLLGAVGGTGNATVLARLDAIEAEVGEINERVDTANAEAERIRAVRVDEDELRALLSDFTPLWDALFQAERERVLRLLITSIKFDGRSGEVTLHTVGDE